MSEMHCFICPTENWQRTLCLKHNPMTRNLIVYSCFKIKRELNRMAWAREHGQKRFWKKILKSYCHGTACSTKRGTRDTQDLQDLNGQSISSSTLNRLNCTLLYRPHDSTPVLQIKDGGAATALNMIHTVITAKATPAPTLMSSLNKQFYFLNERLAPNFD